MYVVRTNDISGTYKIHMAIYIYIYTYIDTCRCTFILAKLDLVQDHTLED